MLNEHKNIDEANLHESKGFSVSLNNGSMVRGERGLSVWDQRMILPAALSLVSSMSAPPTENNGDIYIINAVNGNLDVNTILWQSGSTIRYTLNGAHDLSALTIDDYLKVTTAGNSLNNGRFVITNFSDPDNWIEVTNTARTSAAEDEGAGSPAVGQVTKSNWDGCGQGEWVRYNTADAKWYYIEPLVGMLCYIIDSGTWYTFSGGTTSSAGSQTGITAFAGGGQGSAYQLTKKKNKVTTVATTGDSVKAPDAFVDNEFMVINAGANDMDLFPKTGQNFWNQAANVAFIVVSGGMVKWYCFTAGEWEQI